MNPEIQKNLKFNIAVNVGDGAFFGMAMGFASYFSILPLFVSSISNSAILIGLIPAIHGAAWMLPQLFTARTTARQSRLRPLVLALSSQERIPYLGLALVAWFLPQMSKELALTLIFGLIIWQSLGAGVTANPWQSMIAKIIPPDRRGTFLGAQAAAANLLAMVAAVAAGFVLDRVIEPRNFVLLFLLAGAGLVISYVFLALTREPATTSIELPPDGATYWRSLGSIIKRDVNFARFLVARIVSQFATMGFAFYIVYAVRQLGVGDIESGYITGMLLVTQILANLGMGWLGDRTGHRLVIEIGLVSAMLSSLLAWWAPTSAWFYPIVILAGITNVALWTNGMGIVMEFGNEADRPAYIGLANTLVAPATILAPFLGGWLASRSGYPTTFMISAAGALISLILFHILVIDPRKNRLTRKDYSPIPVEPVN